MVPTSVFFARPRQNLKFMSLGVRVSTGRIVTIWPTPMLQDQGMSISLPDTTTASTGIIQPKVVDVRHIFRRRVTYNGAVGPMLGQLREHDSLSDIAYVASANIRSQYSKEIRHPMIIYKYNSMKLWSILSTRPVPVRLHLSLVWRAPTPR